MGLRSIQERVRELAGRVALDHGLELVHAEVGGPAGKPELRIFIDKPGGVTHENCAAVSLHLGTILDVEDFINSAYILEVSSPGLERGLYQLGDFERFAGSQAKIRANTPIGGQRNFRGLLLGVEENRVLLEDRTSGRVSIPLEVIAKANLEFDFEAELHKTPGGSERIV